MTFRKSCGDTIRQLQKKYDEKDKANRKMISYLSELLENDKITNDYDKDFIRSVEARINQDIPLSEKQQAHLDKCYHDRY